MTVTRELIDDAGSLARGLMAVPAGLLPRRRWAVFDALPVERMAGLSALVTLVVGGAIGVRGFFLFAEAASNDLAGAALKVATRQAADPRGAGTISMLPAMTASGLSPLAFLVATPAGWLTMYLVVTGLARALGAWFGDAAGDPILSGVDHLVTRGRANARQSRARRAREREEGPEVPDRLYRAEWADVAGADFVVVSSRQKPDWTRGTLVITSGKWYTLGESFHLRLPEGLRTIYPLTEHSPGEVLRRGVPYELPPLEPTAGADRAGAAQGRR